MRTAIILASIVLVAVVIVFWLHPVIPIFQNNIIITDASLVTQKLSQYASDNNITIYTTASIYSEVPAFPEESSTYLTAFSINNVSVQGVHNEWEKLYIMYGYGMPSLDSSWWTIAGYWLNGTYYQVSQPSFSAFIRLLPMMTSPVGKVTITYNGNRVITVDAPKEGQAYMWGQHYISQSGQILYRKSYADRIYSFIWDKHPSALMLIGGAGQVPAFRLEWIFEQQGNNVETVTDNPYTVPNVYTDSLLKRSFPLGRYPVETPSEVDAVVDKIKKRKDLPAHKSLIVRSASIGFPFHDYIIEAWKTQERNYQVTILTDVYKTEAINAINSGNDFILLSGHGDEFSIWCCGGGIGVADVSTAIHFTTSTFGFCMGCYTGDFIVSGGLGQIFMGSTTNNLRAWIASAIVTNTDAIGHVANQLAQHYRQVGEGRAFMDAINIFEDTYHLYAHDPEIEFREAIIQRCAIQFFGCPF